MKAFGTARLGSDMELRFMPDGTPVGQVSLAFKLGIKDKSSGEYKTQWINASMFGKRAETLAPMLKKGALHGFFLKDIHDDEYTNKDGEKRVTMKATIEDVELCGKQESQPADKQEMAGTTQHQSVTPAVKQGFDNFDDDIPF